MIRHGEPVGGRRYRGQVDDPLSEKGWQQMWTAVGDRAPWRHIVTSPLSRCREFAVALGTRHGIPVTDDPRLTEIGFGVWEGRTPDELRRDDPDILTRFFNDPVAHRPAGAEPLDQFVGRVREAWYELLDNHAGKHLLLVAHAGVIRAVISLVLEIPASNMFRIKVANAGISRIRIDPALPPTLVFHHGQP